jgi:GAF domain-containing protein
MEKIIITATNKGDIYKELLPQIKSVIGAESDVIANMANICAIIKEGLKYFWVGFYIVKGEELVLGPFQGPLACTRIKFGKGVCGTAWKSMKSITVANVDEFPGHIACSSLSKSEIVIPIIRNKIVVGVLDIDSLDLNSFDDIDRKNLEEIVSYLVF